MRVGYSDVETTIHSKDGRAMHIYTTGLRYEYQGRPCMIGIGIDIGARLAAEAALRATSERMERQYAALAALATLPAESRGERILVVDDEPVLTTLADRCLTRLGYRVTTRNDPAAALTLFRDEMFDLIITDLAMPHITGLELARQMLHLRPGTKILLMTGFSATMDASAARENGFREMLLKPYNIQELSSTVRRVLDEA